MKTKAIILTFILLAATNINFANNYIKLYPSDLHKGTISFEKEINETKSFFHEFSFGISAEDSTRTSPYYRGDLGFNFGDIYYTEQKNFKNFSKYSYGLSIAGYHSSSYTKIKTKISFNKYFGLEKEFFKNIFFGFETKLFGIDYKVTYYNYSSNDNDYSHGINFNIFDTYYIYFKLIF